MAYRYFIQLAYNGKAYGGWQSQPNADTVQKWMQNSLTSIAGLKDCVTGCGRTDAGVNASQFFAHFDHENSLSPDALQQITFRLNRYLPQDICIHKIIPVKPGAHARYSALQREYEYLIIRKKDPFRFTQAYFVHGFLNIELMNTCAALLLGRHDYKSFSKVKTQVNNYFCDVKHASWTEDEHMLKFTIQADRFLRNMVRAIVGTLLDVGREKISITEFQQIIDSQNRNSAGYSVPAQGLTLTEVSYPEEIFSDIPIFFSQQSSEKIISHYYTDPEFHEGSGNKANE